MNVALRGWRSLDSTDSTLIIAELARHPHTTRTHITYFLYSLRYYGLFKTKPTIFRPFKTFMIHLKFRFLIKYVVVSLVFSNVIFVLRTLFLISLVEPE